MRFDTIRTPKDRFENLKDFPFDANYVDCLGYRIHYVDVGEGPLILLLHGEPSWSYLYRKMIPLLVENGYRAVAPDILGFGKSDKLVKGRNYSYQLLVDIKTEFVKKLDQPVEVMVIQDWGSLIGFRLLETVGEKIKRVLVANGVLPAAGGFTGLFGHFLFKMRVKLMGKVSRDDLEEDINFVKWVAYTQTAEEFPVGDIVQRASAVELSEEEIHAYDAPFPDETYKEGARQLPILVTSQLRKNKQVWDDVLKQWDKPMLTLFGKDDPITSGWEKRIIARVPGAKGLDHKILEPGAHFIQEDQPEELVNGIISLMEI